MPDSKADLKHPAHEHAPRQCACTLLDSFLEERLHQLSETEVRKLHQLASNWLSGKSTYAEARQDAIELLSPREIEILKLLGRGLSMKGTARGLAISPGTVKWHVKNLYEKLGASSREDALSKARLRQLIH